MINKNLDLIKEFCKELDIDFVNDEIINCMYELIEMGMDPVELIRVVDQILEE
ncbi:hypothetical protein G9O61_00g014490 [Vairimorpha ceranae]|nr:hypothetical protein G9O61_00g014490 [Vairimorpha ceranae]